MSKRRSVDSSSCSYSSGGSDTAFVEVDPISPNPESVRATLDTKRSDVSYGDTRARALYPIRWAFVRAFVSEPRIRRVTARLAIFSDHLSHDRLLIYVLQGRSSSTEPSLPREGSSHRVRM